ncbi:MAG TPA: alpha/beta hydrolase family protein [Dongiaceae bacterium]|nr:alpha/beta hydrolase family protein [Dongiaceae bacterium]
MLSATMNLESTPDWVYQLPEDFYRQPHRVQAPFDPAMTLTVLVDLAVRTGLAAYMAGIRFPLGYSGFSLGTTLRGERTSHTGSDADVFHQPRPLPTFTITEAPRPKGVEGGIFEQIRWQSIYEAATHASHINNDAVIAWYWRHGDKPRPTIVLVHGFLASWWEVNDFYLGSHFLYELGCDVVLKTLPHHGPRSRTAKNVTGMDFVTRGIDALNHAVVQSTYDIRTLLDFLQQRGVERMGITGVSLGGYTSALMAGLDERLEFAIPLVPLVSLPDAMMEWKPLDTVLKSVMRWYGVSMHDIRATTALHSPLSRPVLLPPERLLIIGGLGDRMATPRHSEALQQHWGNCALHWYAGAHALPRQQAQTNQVKKAFLEQIHFTC